MRFAALAALALHVVVLAQTPPPRTDRERADAAAKRTADRLRALQREADALAAQERTLLVDLRKLEVDRQISVEQLTRIDREREETQQKLTDAEARAAELARQADAQLPDVEARLVQLYKLGRAGYWRLLLNAEDMQALGRAYRTASTLTALDRARVTEHYKTLDALARERKALQARAEEITSLQAEATRTRDRLDKAVAGRSGLVKSIDARRDLNAQLMGELQNAQQRLQASVAKLGAGEGAAPLLPLRPFQGDLPWPAKGRVTRRFGRQPRSQSGAAVVRNGMDLAVAEGQPVRSVHEGTVAYADQFAGYGNLVILEHGGRSYSLYGYLGALEVTRGQRVDPQTVLGISGRDPSGNPALYFELRVDGAAVDPLQWLRK
ncbi:MAG: murein hydrolase activator EnvC family protein [Vicinamibacterales bacterium]